MKTDLVSIFINFSHSLPAVQSLVSGFGYLIGIILIMLGFFKLQESAGGGSHDRALSSIMYFVAGAMLLYLPTMVDTLSNTFFGSDNVLSYDYETEDPFYEAMRILIQTAGVIWFVRGSVLLLRTGKPGIKDSSRGLVYITAGILAINIENTAAAIEYSLNMFVSLTGTGTEG